MQAEKFVKMNLVYRDVPLPSVAPASTFQNQERTLLQRAAIDCNELLVASYLDVISDGDLMQFLY